MKKKFESPELVQIRLKITENIATSGGEVSGTVSIKTDYNELGLLVYVDSSIQVKDGDNITGVMYELFVQQKLNCLL